LISVTGRELTTSQWLLRSLRLDGVLLVLIGVLLALGLVVLFSATGESVEALERQMIRIAIGLVALLAVARIPVSTLRAWSPWLFLVGVALLVAVMFAGDMSARAQGAGWTWA
jgi:rod shape determining protein RodA